MQLEWDLDRNACTSYVASISDSNYLALYRMWFFHTSYFWKSSVFQGSNHQTRDKPTIIYSKEWTAQQLAPCMNAFTGVSNLKPLLHTVPYIWASAGLQVQDSYSWYLTWINAMNKCRKNLTPNEHKL